MEPEEILIKLRRAIGGQTVLDESTSTLLANVLRNENRSPPLNQIEFTSREEQIVSLIAEGKSNKVIARELGISDGTVKVHVKNVLRKLNLSSRLEAAVWAAATSAVHTAALADIDIGEQVCKRRVTVVVEAHIHPPPGAGLHGDAALEPRRALPDSDPESAAGGIRD